MRVQIQNEIDRQLLSFRYYTYILVSITFSISLSNFEGVSNGLANYWNQQKSDATPKILWDKKGSEGNKGRSWQIDI
jgi:hypothetical protein